MRAYTQGSIAADTGSGAGDSLPTSPRLPSSVNRLPGLVCWLLIITFAVYFSALAVQQHRAFQTNGLDVGNVDQALWNTAQGRFMQFTLMTPIQSRLALHVEPILLLLVPFYWLRLGSPEMLLIVQATVVAVGAWPLYKIAVINLPTPGSDFKATPYVLRSTYAWLALIFPLAYLLLPTLQSTVLFEFHAVTLAPTFFLFAFWALERGNHVRFIFFLLLAMACKEDMPLVAAMLGLYAGLSRRQWRLAGLTIGLSLSWFVVAFFVIQPRFAVGGNIQLDRYAWLGDNPPAMLKTLFNQPGLVLNHVWYRAGLPGYLANLFFPTAFLALFSPLALLPALPALAVNMLSDNPFTWRLEDFHYGAPLAPFLFIASIYGIRRVSRWAAKRTVSHNLLVTCLLACLLLTFTIIYHYHRGFTPLARPFQWPQVTTHHRHLEDVLRAVAADSALFTQSNLAPHLTHRPTLYTEFAYFTDPLFPAPVPVDDIVLDITTFENIGGLHQFLRRELLDSGDYRVVSAQAGIVRLQPAFPVPPSSTVQPLAANFRLPMPFYTFAQPATPAQYNLTADFGDVVRLHGYTLHFNRQEEIQVSLDLEPLQPLTDDTVPVLYLLDASGRPIGATVDLQPGLVWLPPSRWTAGETVRVRFNTLPWHTREMQNYRLALGLLTGNDAWDIGRRYRPAITQSAQIAPRFAADGTLLELARIEQRWHMPAGGPLLRRFNLPGLPYRHEANFANQIRLLGHSLPKITNGQSPALSISLYWQAVSRPPHLTRFVQLIGPDGLVYGQHDSTPEDGHYPTDLWQPGEVVVESVTFPVQIERPAGVYSLHVGLYDPDSGRRLNLAGGIDHVEIGLKGL